MTEPLFWDRVQFGFTITSGCKDRPSVAPNSTPTADAAPMRTATISITFVMRPMKRSVIAPAATVDQKADAPWDGSHGSSAYW